MRQLEENLTLLKQHKEQLDSETASIERTFILSGGDGMASRGIALSKMGFDNLRSQIATILQRCYPETKVTFMEPPTEKEIRTTPAPGEEAIKNENWKKSLREFHLLALAAQIAIDEGIQKITREIGELRQSITTTPVTLPKP